ncbi:MAG: PVC-type heme-binding CxxCH protein [Verrucomicrobiales bacterium]
MKRLFVFLFIWCASLSLMAQQSKPLRVFIRAGVKTHGPGQHDHPRFLEEWKKLLTDRGAQANGKLGFPSGEELENTDVLVVFAAEAGSIAPEDRANLDKFLKRGGGIVTIHDAVCGNDPQWFKTIIGGAWEHGKSKWYEGEVGAYFIDTNHPITKGISNFDVKDEIYWDLHMMPEARVLASSFHSVFVIAPQMWVYEKDNYRSFVSILGHEYDTFNLLHYRALLLRGIAWAGKRENVDYLCKPEELNSLTYPEGGPTAPEKAVAKLNPHPDFTVNLVASEPLFEKAISMDWDEQGRLWVAETPEYPNGRRINRNDRPIAQYREMDPANYTGDKEDRPGRDRISYLIDTDGDGRADKKHVFFDGLELVTSLVFYKDGVIVAQAPDILWIRDTDKDGKGDKVEKLYTGFGTGDTHAVISNFRRGMDGWIYSSVGYSAGNPVSGTSDKNFGRISAGILRFKPDGSALEQVSSGSCNTWGFDFAADGEMFFTTATCGEHLLHVVMPEKALARGSVGGIRAFSVLPDHQKAFPPIQHKRPAYVQIDWVGQFTAAAGCAIYTGGAWPEEYDGTSFLSETTINLVHNDWIKPKGSTYVAVKEPGREENEFLVGNDLWFRPIHQRVGPDGALYLIDFYNQAAIHNDTRGPAHGANNAAVRPDRDHHFGRIYRIQHKQAKKLPEANLAQNNPANWVKALEHPNGWVRMTAHRLLADNKPAAAVESLKTVIRNGSPLAQVHAMYILQSYGKLDDQALKTALNSKESVVRKNALHILADNEAPAESQKADVIAALKDPDQRARIQALIALANYNPSEDIAQAVVQAWPTLVDKYQQSAAIGVANRDPQMFLAAAFKAQNSNGLSELVGHISRQLALKQDAAAAANLVVFLSNQPARSDELKRLAIEAIAANLRADNTPAWSADLKQSLARIINSENQALRGSILPLVARWDKSNELANDVKPMITQLSNKLTDESLSDDARAQIAANLLGVSRLNSGIIPAVGKVLQSNNSPEFQKRIVEALGAVNEPAAGAQLIENFSQLSPDLREAAFGQILKREDWSMALINSIADKKLELLSLGPISIHRLRTHPAKTVADKASQTIDALRGPEQKEKDALIEQFTSVAEQPGNLANGHKVFTENCAACHKYKGEGSDLAPDLTGMGAHGAHELLVHIIDPNRVVEPNFITTSIETKDELSYDGIVVRENRTSLTLRTANGTFEIRQADIVSRRNTGLSLMPNGFEALGKENLRDLIAYISADENRYRVIELTEAFTVDSTKGIYNTRDNVSESIPFKKFGLTKVDDVPFDIVHPLKSRSGNNLIVLKGGQGYSTTLPQKVSVNTQVKANRLHFLGGVGGWAFPCCGDNKNENTPVAKVTLQYADNSTEELILRNGREFADYIGKFDVPDSKEAPDLVRRGQVRWFSKDLKRGGEIRKLTIESYNNNIAPTFVAITADSAPVSKDAKTTSAKAPNAKSLTFSGDGIKTLIIGGGSSHDFSKWFNKADTATLSEGGLASVQYTEDTSLIRDALKQIDVLYLSNNKPIEDTETRKAIFEFVAAGKGLLLVHPALWYNWNDWPEYNAQLAGGGARNHDNFGAFDVKVTAPSHPIMKNVPAEFNITDELYRFVPDPKGNAINVLATGFEKGPGKTFPVIYTTQVPKGRVVGITLGHDGKAHDHPAFKTILRNSLKWAAGKE